MHTLEELQNAALELPVEDRVQLMQALQESVMTGEDREFERALIEESERRYQEWKADRARSVSGDEALARLRQKYGSDSLRASRRR